MRIPHNPLVLLLAFLLITPYAWSQANLGDLPAEVNVEDAAITKMGRATMTMHSKIVTDSVTRRSDTIIEMKSIEWNTESGTAKRRNSERGGGGNNPNGSGFYNYDYDWWLDICYYNFNYPSINANGERVLLSAMACMPDEDCDYVNNVIIGCHVTITSNKECPSQFVEEGSSLSDVSLLMNHAGSGLVFHSAQSDMPYYNLVILPDYEGYGITRSHAHPYLYQELTARQVVDAVRYGIALYQKSPTIDFIRHPFRNGWRSICLGYSQGGSVAMATQRFIEQNGLTDELQLAGSICGDGPYDPMATLLYYVKQYRDGDPLSMPVVMPLILKGMCDWNPYMRNHQESDYLVAEFLNSGILDKLTEKEMTTDDITDMWLVYYKWIWGLLPFAELHLHMNDLLYAQGIDYFNALYDANPNYTSAAGVPLPTQRGVMEDLHFALASNDLTRGWVPQHVLLLYHSFEDTVVPEVNRQSAANALGEWVIKIHASGSWQFDHVNTGRQFFLGTEEFTAIRKLAKAPVHQTIQDARDMKNNYDSNSLDD